MSFHSHLYGLIQKEHNHHITKTWALRPGQGLLVTSGQDIIADKFTAFSKAQKASITGQLEVFAVLDEDFGLLMTHILHPKRAVLAYRHSNGSHKNSIHLTWPKSKSQYKGTIGKTLNEAKQLAAKL